MFKSKLMELGLYVPPYIEDSNIKVNEDMTEVEYSYKHPNGLIREYRWRRSPRSRTWLGGEKFPPGSKFKNAH